MKHWKQILVILAVIALTYSVAWAVVTYKYVYPGETEILDTTVAADSAYDYTSNIDLETNGYYGTWVTVEYTINGTADDMVVSYFASFDGSAWDTIPLYSFTMANNDSGSDQVTFLLYPCPSNGRIGVKGDTGTDTIDVVVTSMPVRGVDDSS